MRYAFVFSIAALTCAPSQQQSNDMWTGTFSAPERRAQFELIVYQSNGRDNIGVARYGLGRPEPGRYPLGIFDRSKPGAFYAGYNRNAKNPADTAFGYVSTAGELIITSSSPQRVEGTIRFTGAEFSAGWRTGQRGSGSPDKVEPNAPTIEVAATFSAIPYSPPDHICMDSGGPSVLVEVRDTNGKPAATGATLEIREGSFRETSNGSPDGLHLGTGDGRPGTYEGLVSKPGYKSVTLHAIRAPADSICHYAEPTDIRKITLELLR